MPELRLEFTVEPFVPGHPGPHVHAAIEAARRAGLPVDVGPFSTIVEGSADAVLDVLRDVAAAAFEHHAQRLSVQLERATGDGP
jgi:uncharacterized protein YqgV (UPF0045/DUF77 family)